MRIEFVVTTILSIDILSINTRHTNMATDNDLSLHLQFT
jgi:hypothetical protein